MMVLRKKELIAASLVILIGVAGYLNWSYQDTISVKDGASYIETGKKLGEAQYVSTVDEVEEKDESKDKEKEDADEVKSTASETVEDKNGNYFEEARLNRETARSKSIEILNQTAANESFDEEIRKKAGDKIINSAANVEKEASIESIAQSKGYDEVCVYIDDTSATVSVRKKDFSENDVTVLGELVISKTDLNMQDVKIIEVK